MNILFTENNALSREMKRCLARDDVHCDLASNDTEALLKIRKNIKKGTHFDLIFLFKLLPDPDESDILLKIRSIEEENCLSGSSVIIISNAANRDENHLSDVFRGCTYYLSLPIDRLKLAMILESVHNDFVPVLAENTYAKCVTPGENFPHF